jgi:hypothetical protein
MYLLLDTTLYTVQKVSAAFALGSAHAVAVKFTARKLSKAQRLLEACIHSSALVYFDK